MKTAAAQAEGDAGVLVERLRRLEREVLELRRSLSPPSEALPAAPFDALELRCGESLFLLPVAHIREVVPMTWLAPLPGAPSWLLGSLQFGERAVPVVDLRRRVLDHEGQAGGRVTDFIVVLDRPAWRGLVVTAVGDVILVEPERLVAPQRGTPLSPWIVASLPVAGAGLSHLLSAARVGTGSLLDED